MLSIGSLSQFHELMGYSKPEHPLISVVDLSTAEMKSTDQKLVTELYSISIKTKHSNKPVMYGQQHLDFSEGVLVGMAPGQVYGLEEPIVSGELEGWAIMFHPDLVQGYALQQKLSDLGFFDYATHEALHLSEKERDNLHEMALKIAEECATNIDDYSNDVLVANLELMLNYIKRYYGRQFNTRKASNSDLLSRFEQELKAYMNRDDLQEMGLPSVSYFSDKLNLSSSYFSDLLKKETGMNAQDHLHHAVIKKAKAKLLNSDSSISQIAYELGFEHAPYFTRLFKKKTGKTPQAFRVGMN